MEHLTRQKDLIDSTKLSKRITVIGSGAIGSFATLQLAKMGATNIMVVDCDMVSVENMNCQFYRFKDIGLKKVDALKALVHDFTGLHIQTLHQKLTKDNLPSISGIVLLCVDSMESRRELFYAIQEKCPTVTHVIDSRMGAEDCLMYVMNPQDKKDAESYEKTLYTNDQAVAERCTAKATIYTANMLSGLVAKAVKNIIMSETYPRTANWSIKHNAFQAWGNT